MTDPTPSPGPAPRTNAPRRSDRFFAWTAGLGLVRSEGWIGGVCAGIAARLRIDPVIVRGVFVVATLFGVPLVFVYALLWALLPDLQGRIHARDLVRGRFEPVQFGILALLVLGLIPVGPAFVLVTGMPLYYVATPGLGGWSLLSAFTVLFLLGAGLALVLLVLIVRASRRSSPLAGVSGGPAAALAPAPATGSGPVASGDGRGADAAGFAAFAPAPDPSTAVTADPSPEPPVQGDEAPAEAVPADAAAVFDPGVEPALGEHATADEVAAWRAQHSAWREREQAWRRHQQDAERFARDQARQERQAQANAFAAEAAERRRIRRLTKPRTSAAYVGLVVGLAVVVGSLLALADGGFRGLAAGLLAAAAVVALAMVVAGFARRRSGFLAFACTLLLLAGAGTATASVAWEQHAGSWGISNVAQDFPASAPFRQLWWGDLTVSLQDTGTDAEIHVERRSGQTSVYVASGVVLELDATVPPGSIYVPNGDEWGLLLDDQSTGVAFTSGPVRDGRTRYLSTLSNAVAGAEPTTVRLVLDQTEGWVQVVLDPPETQPDPEPTPIEGDTDE